jgi:hypothetical protein
MLAVTAALAVSGCGSASPTAAPAAGSATGGAAADGTAGGQPAITTATARRVFDGYVAATAKAAQTGDGAQALAVVTGVQRAVLAARLTSTGADKNPQQLQAALDLYRYGSPTFYLPEQAGYPRFFVASVTRALSGTVPADDLSTQVGGVKVAVDGPALMLFSQAAGGAAWQLASVSQLPPGTARPALARDAAGSVPQVPLSASGLLIRPSFAGALQAAVVDDGPASAASRVVAAGPLTTGMYQGSRTRTLGLEPPLGDEYQWTLEGSTLPAFALRTADGGALVFYTMTLNTTVAVPDVINKADPVRPGRPIQVPDSVLPLLPPGTPATPREQLQSEETLSFAAVDPPGSNGKLAVVAIGGGLTAASAA